MNKKLLILIFVVSITLGGCGLFDRETPIKSVSLATDWTWQGVYAAYPVAKAEGYYEEEGIDITIDRGYGSGDTITKVAAGVYDFGVADFGVLIQFNSENPTEALTAVAIMWDYSPLTILTLTNRGIETPQDLVGRELAAPAGSASRIMFPAFAQAVGIDPDSVSWNSVSPELRETMLVEGDVDATAPFLDAIITLQGLGIDPDEIKAFHYPEYGLEIYGLALITRPEIINEQPDVVSGVVRATIRGWIHTIADPDNAIEVLKQVDPLIDEQVERARLDLVLERLIITPWVIEHGFGAADPVRIEAHIDAAYEAMNLEIRPDPATLFTSEFLPPLDDRRIP
ncbi:MAG: ABC transporter substrate-binding protein [Anaerolineales bacterium]|nr:ABC transporter substrate-binding protein [Anaerolineales bacterium]